MKYKILAITCCAIFLATNTFAQTDLNKSFEMARKVELANSNITEYAKACEMVGDYFLKQKQYDSALHYYNKINYGDGDFPNEYISELWRKVNKIKSDIYYNGKPGVTKNRLRAFYCDMNYLNHNPETRQIAMNYSKKYFNTTKDTLHLYSGKDSLVIAINPFFLNDSITLHNIREQLRQLQLDERAQVQALYISIIIGTLWDINNIIGYGAYGKLIKFWYNEDMSKLKYYKLNDYREQSGKVASPYTNGEINWPVIQYVWSEDTTEIERLQNVEPPSPNLEKIKK